MADALAMSMGGRIASIYKQNNKRRRFTQVTNDIESKRLTFVKKQLNTDQSVESGKLNRSNNQALNASDELKAFQVALLRRIAVVQQESKLDERTRPLQNLGRYGGASIEQIKAESEKYRKIRDPEKRRILKAKLLLEQGKKDGRIKSYTSETLGNMAISILKLTKADPLPESSLPVLPDITTTETTATKLENVQEVEDQTNTSQPAETTSDEAEKVSSSDGNLQPKQRHGDKQRRLVLPPMQVSRSMKPNNNYYRKISADYHGRAQYDYRTGFLLNSPNRKRLSILQDIRPWHERGGKKQAQGNKTMRMTENASTGAEESEAARTEPMTSSTPPQPNSGGESPEFEWTHEKALNPVRTGKHLNDAQKFWRQQDSLAIGKLAQHKRVVLPKIGKL